MQEPAWKPGAIEKCRICGCDMRGRPTPVCPECGHENLPEPCPACGGSGAARIIPPIWVCLVVLGVSGLLFMWLRHSAKPRDISTYLVPAALALTCLVLNLIGCVRGKCGRCRGTGRERRIR